MLIYVCDVSDRQGLRAFQLVKECMEFQPRVCSALISLHYSNYNSDNRLCGWHYVVCCSRFLVFAGLTAGCSLPLMLTVRNGELVERRLSHSLGWGSGTDSMKLLFIWLMLVWWRIISVWVLSKSFNKNVYSKSEQVCRWKVKVIGENQNDRKLKREKGGRNARNNQWKRNCNCFFQTHV